MIDLEILLYICGYFTCMLFIVEIWRSGVSPIIIHIGFLILAVIVILSSIINYIVNNSQNYTEQIKWSQEIIGLKENVLIDNDIYYQYVVNAPNEENMVTVSRVRADETYVSRTQGRPHIDEVWRTYYLGIFKYSQFYCYRIYIKE